MAIDWTTKEKIVLISDILEYGDQSESWPSISNDLSHTFQTNIVLSQAKREGRYSIKNCKQEYKQLVNRYKSQWTEHGSLNNSKLPLAKYIWAQLKSIYRAELTQQLNESRKKLTEFCLRLESVVNIKSNIIEPAPSLLLVETTNSVLISQENEISEGKTSTIETISQSIKEELTMIPSESVQSTSSCETNTATSILNRSQEATTNCSLLVPDNIQIKEEIKNTVSDEITDYETNSLQHFPTNSSNSKQNPAIIEEESSRNTTIDSPPLNVLSDPQSTISVTPSVCSTNTITRPESASSSRSTSRTSSETKTDVVKNVPITTPKYHVYFSPKNSISNNLGMNKTKSKRKTIDDVKDENETESINQTDLLSASAEQLKVPSSTAPMTRRSINTRSVPNTVAEQEEEKSRRFSAMLSENPSSWQSQSMSIIQFILSHKQGYLFEHEITEEIAPRYHHYIRRPIALDTIRKTLESNEYQAKEPFKRDIYLMLYNAMKYNPRNHHVHRAAKHLFNITIPLFNLSAQEIQGQITAKTNASLPTTTLTSTSACTATDIPVAKRKRTK